MIPGPPAICEGEVFHRRSTPADHAFTYDVSYVWLDPDRPEALVDHHPLWSARRPAPARFRASDYGDGSGESLGEQVRRDLGPVLGPVDGPVRMLTQVRRWGWLFNPITVFLAWSDPSAPRPDGAVLEVTNTPWKERVRYPLALEPLDDHTMGARFAKNLHVSPFLGEDYDYQLRLLDDDTVIDLGIDVVTPGTDEAIVTTRLVANRHEASHERLTTSLLTNVAPTHRVSAGIHAQAARLALKRVPFVRHPRSRPPTAKETVS